MKRLHFKSEAFSKGFTLRPKSEAFLNNSQLYLLCKSTKQYLYIYYVNLLNNVSILSASEETSHIVESTKAEQIYISKPITSFHLKGCLGSQGFKTTI